MTDAEQVHLGDLEMQEIFVNNDIAFGVTAVYRHNSEGAINI